MSHSSGILFTYRISLVIYRMPDLREINYTVHMVPQGT